MYYFLLDRDDGQYYSINGHSDGVGLREVYKNLHTWGPPEPYRRQGLTVFFSFSFLNLEGILLCMLLTWSICRS